PYQKGRGPHRVRREQVHRDRRRQLPDRSDGAAAQHDLRDLAGVSARAAKERGGEMTIGIGMVGSGFMSLTYAHGISNLVPDARLVAIEGGHRVGEFAERFGLAV